MAENEKNGSLTGSALGKNSRTIFFRWPSETIPETDKSCLGNGRTEVSFDGGVGVREVGKKGWRPVYAELDSERMPVNIFPDHVASEGRRIPAVPSSSGKRWRGATDRPVRISPGEFVAEFREEGGGPIYSQEQSEQIFCKGIGIRMGPAVFVDVILAGVEIFTDLLL
jgi:hypothetical protein